MPSFLDAAPRPDLVLSAALAETIYWPFADDDGKAIDYTGSTFDLNVKARDSADNPYGPILLTLSTGSGIAGTVAQGEVNPTFPAEADGGLPPGAYVYECRRLVSGTPIELIAVGTIDVTQD